MKTLPEHNLDKLAALFPSVITEVQDEDGKLHKAVDFEKLRLILEPDEKYEGREYYSFTWAGKRNAVTEAGRPTDKVLRPCIEESKDFETTQNLYIEGENLEVLKIIQTAYMNKIKMIYIDPPYNTGHDFIYNDDYSYDRDEDMQQFRIFDEDGRKNFSSKNYSESTKSNPRFHSDWCSMIYPRLVIARNILSDDGVIFISIDDNEQANLRKICDEIFGEDNFVAQLIWERAFAPKNDAKYISASHDYILMYAKNIQAFTIGRLPRTEEANARYSNPDNDPRGVWMSGNLLVKTYSALYDYPVTTPSGRIVTPPTGRCWRLSKDSFMQKVKENRIWFGDDGDGVPRLKRFITELRHEGLTPTSILHYEDVGHSQEGAQKVAKILGGLFFTGPKPVRLLQHLMTLANLEDDDTVLDFFSGSATTAHAVMNLNSEDGGHHKFIMVQIQESCPPQSEAYKAGFTNICEIGKERIRRAGENLNGDTGFRVLKLDTSNMRDVYIFPKEFTQFVLDDLIENIKPDRTGIDLLFGEAADSGMPLSLPYKSENVSGFMIHIYGDNDIIACFDENINEELIKNIAKRKPQRAVFRDSCFENSSVKINLEQIFKFYAPNSDIKVL